jgi:hypothetical protein
MKEPPTPKVRQESQDSLPIDDLNEGSVYCFHMGRSFVRGEFAGFIRERGRPLVIMVARPLPSKREILSFPTTLITRISRPHLA